MQKTMFAMYKYIQVIIALITAVRGDSVNFSSSKFNLPKKYTGIDMSTEIEIAEILNTYKPVDFNTGAPSYLPPAFVKNMLQNVSSSCDPTVHQYSAADGHPSLRQSIASLYSSLVNVELDPKKNIIITIGASEALYSTFQAFTSPGDEWIIIEPAFIPFPSLVEMAGGKPRFVKLRPKITGSGKISSNDWLFDKEEMTKAFNIKTKGILINTPHNPTGKIFTREELLFIADLANKWNTLIIADEVYEWLVYKSNQFLRIASLEDLFNRTIIISSSSKTFSITGWRIGWILGPSNLLNNIKIIHSRVVYSNPTPLQISLAASLDNIRTDLTRNNSYFSNYLTELQEKRNFVVSVLDKIGMSPTVPDAGLYVIANWTSLESKTQIDNEDKDFRDIMFTKWLAKNVGVLVAPVSRFYGKGEERYGESFVRFCFVRKFDELKKGLNLLLDWVENS